MSHPDASIHPEATGKAKSIVNAHQQPEPSVVQRVWTVLEVKGIPYQYVEVNPYNKPESLLKLNPRGLVPTLQYDEKPLYESNVICEFLEDAYPDSTPRLLPSDPYEKARLRIWMDFVTSRIIPSYHRFLQFQPDASLRDQSSKGLEKVRSDFLQNLREFSAEMLGSGESGPYFLGKHPSLIDFVLAPWAVRLWVFDEFKGGLGIPSEGRGEADELTWRRWRSWLGAISTLPAVRETMSDKEHYLPIYKR
ncbi:MAG: hypothetical protein M1837_004614 [Sclerophora amabilis]|nr:MAG: hypothetical protein M1837_004614 [Sclerophora amabilis]